jgi:hypothetical protein
MTDTSPDDGPIDALQDTQPLPDVDELTESDPKLHSVGEKIEDAQQSAQEIFGEHEDDTDDGDDPDADLGGSAPVP